MTNKKWQEIELQAIIHVGNRAVGKSDVDKRYCRQKLPKQFFTD